MNAIDNGYVYIVHAWYADQKDGPDDVTAHGFFFTELEAMNYVSELKRREDEFKDGAPFRTVIHTYTRA